MDNVTMRRTRSVGSMLVFAAIALALAINSAYAPSELVASQEATIAGMPVRPECPLTDSIIADTPYVAAPTSNIPVAGPLSHIPEFHDCQRFIRRRVVIIPKWFSWGWRYDALYAIFASFRLDSLWLDTTKSSTVPSGACDSAMVMDPNSPCFGFPQGTQLTVLGRGVAFAEVVSWGGTYKPLGIGPGYNCLYLFGPATPRAFMVRQGLANDKCPPLASLPTGTNVKELQVRRDTLPVYAAAHYPPVARWDWDRVNSEQYIGIRCGAGWCEVGDTGFRSSPGYSPTPGTVADRRIVEIKGWYDEQRLDVGIPSGIRGTAFPAPGLHRRKIADFEGNWVPAAFISLGVAHPKYQGTFNFEFATLWPQANMAQLDTIELCKGTPEECEGAPTTLSCTWGSGLDSLWWARIKPAAADRPPMYKCVVRRGHEGLGDSIPGTVRWRWMADDETTWVKCAQGCCEVVP